MKKKLLVAAIMAAMTLSASAVFAATPINFSGDGYLQYNNTQGDTGGNNGFDSRIRLNIDGTVDNVLNVHVRAKTLTDLSTSYVGSENGQVQFDQAWVGGKLDNVDLKAGKMSLYSGKGLLMDDDGFNGIQAGAALDGVQLNGFYGKDSGRVKTNIAEMKTAFGDVNFGANYMEYGADHYYGLNADTKVGDAVLNVEYVKNTTTSDNGYMAGVTMGNYTVSYRDIEPTAIDVHTTNTNYIDSKGFKVAARYGLSKNSSITLYQDFAKHHDGSGNHERTNVEYDYNF
ncbi:Hypothetical protein LUCI_3975 [Lucifera butyrica]|uniref:Porin domain-containing protein n=1 Tax=Lucifera butyrica TaxID=1351585 RepID=A0A498RCQ8_9FIRM|nr:hypothetical protein [Lucifera butyrica]VBB08697.1 Hypothetical protein LUCI_3975 [Lucifera butyrica]